MSGERTEAAPPIDKAARDQQLGQWAGEIQILRKRMDHARTASDIASVLAVCNSNKKMAEELRSGAWMGRWKRFEARTFLATARKKKEGVSGIHFTLVTVPKGDSGIEALVDLLLDGEPAPYEVQIPLADLAEVDKGVDLLSKFMPFDNALTRPAAANGVDTTH